MWLHSKIRLHNTPTNVHRMGGKNWDLNSFRFLFLKAQNIFLVLIWFISSLKKASQKNDQFGLKKQFRLENQTEFPKILCIALPTNTKYKGIGVGVQWNYQSVLTKKKYIMK